MSANTDKVPIKQEGLLSLDSHVPSGMPAIQRLSRFIEASEISDAYGRRPDLTLQPWRKELDTFGRCPLERLGSLLSATMRALF